LKRERRDSGNVTAIAFPKKKKWTSGRVTVIICAVIALLIALLFTPLFNVTEITVSGNERVSTEALIEASGIYRGVNTLKANLGQARKRISTIAYIDTVKVERRFPGRVVITVTESQEAAYLPFIGNYVGIDAKGKILEIKPKGTVVDRPVVLGVTISEFNIGSIVKTPQEEQFAVMCQMLKQMEINQLTSGIAQVDVTDLNDIRMYLTNHIAITFGSTDNLNYKLSFLKSVITSPDLSGQQGGVIDMTNPERVTYRANG